MNENCVNSCAGLIRLEQQFDDLRKQNGQDHKTFREEIHDIEMENARQSERYDNLMAIMTETRSDVKHISERITAFSNKADNVDKLEKDVDELKGKSGKTWEDIKSKALGWGVALVLAIVAGAMGLSKFL